MLRKWIVGLLSILLIFSNFNVGMINAVESDDQSELGDSDWELVWSDEFDENEINMDNWSFDHPENGRYNQEIQSYTEDNAWIEDGNLIIEAREEEITEASGETYEYTSSKLITQGKQKWTYGKFEIRAKMPEGQGMWPAIWMMPEDEPFYGTWPVGGEIDIMELLGHEPDRVHANIHYGDPKGESSKTYYLPEGESFADDFYTYTLEWEPGEMRWYIDDELYHTANDWHSRHPSNADDFAYPAPFDQDFFLILNISVGGGWPGNPDDTTPLPQQMEVDYVRVYQKDEYPVREKPEPSEEDSEGREPLEDGNYIYNGDFSSDDSEVEGIEGVSNTDYWEYLTNSGSAELEVEDGELHVGIENGGNVEHAVQLIQTPVHLEEGAKYKASFSAKAERARDLKVKVGGDGSREWADYAAEPPITLSEDWEDYEFEFVMPDRTDLKARFEFNMGLDDADVWLRDVRLEMTEEGPDIPDPADEPRDPLPSGNYIYNGTFDQGTDRMSFWEFRVDESADADRYIGSAVDERRFDALINTGGDHAESIQLVQPQVNLAEDNSYQLTFDASADAARNMEVSLVSTNGNVVSEQIVDLDAETKAYTIEFAADVMTDNDVELRFNMGGSDDNVYLDNVVLVRVLESDGIENNLIRNGIFDSHAYWETEQNHSAADFGVSEEGDFHVNITDVGYDTWAIQLYQEGINIEEGFNYELTFDAMSTIDRPVLLNIEHSTDYTKYLEEVVSMTGDWETFSYEFTMEEPTDPNTKFGFSFGGDGTDAIPNVEHDIFIDNVVLRKIEEVIEEPEDDEGSEEAPGDGESIEELLARISELEERIQELENDSAVEDLENRINALEQELFVLQARYNELEAQNSELEQQLASLEEKIEGMKASIDDQEDERIVEDDDQTDQVTDQTNQQDDVSSGDTLPETATTTFNWLLFGVSVLILGLALVLLTRKKSSITKDN